MRNGEILGKMVRNWCKMDQNGDTLNKHGEKQIVKKGGHIVEKKLQRDETW